MKSIFSLMGTKIAATVLVVIITAVASIGAVNYFNNRNSVNESQEAFNPEFEDDQYREVNEAGASGGIEIPGYSEIRIPQGETQVSVNFYNPESNSVYFEISLSLAETEEEIYKSKLLSPGQHLYEIDLLSSLDAGEYEMIITYNTYAMDDAYTPKNGATVNCKLVVI